MHHQKDVAIATQEATAVARYTSVAVHVEPQITGMNHIEVAGRLARQQDALLIGIGAEALDAGFATDPFTGVVMADVVSARAQQLELDLKAAEASFERDADGARTEWRIFRTFPDNALVEVARAVDLIVMPSIREGGGSPYRRATPGEVIVKSGRPVLIVPRDTTHVHAKSVVVAWKDTREARRAVADAMPFLQAAETVLVHAIVEAGDDTQAWGQVNDVVAALKRHDVSARGNVVLATSEATAAEIDRVAELCDADLIVAGGYGHTRLGEWIFGGVTNEFLHRPGRCVLLSH